MPYSSQSWRAKMLVQCVLDSQAGNKDFLYIKDVLSRRGAKIEDFHAFHELIEKDHLRRSDMYALIFPHNTTEHGKIIHSHLVGLKGKKNVKASIRACFTHLVSNKRIMKEDPVLLYCGREFFGSY